MGQEIRILLLRAPSSSANGLELLLRARPDFELVATCASTPEALCALQQIPADIVLIECELGLQQGLEFLEEAGKTGFKGRVLITTGCLSGGAVLRALEQGSLGIVTRQNQPSDLIKAIYRVVSGELWLDSLAAKAMAEALRSGEHRVWQPLSVREGAVLKGVLDGLKNHQIAVKLQMPESSVKYVIRRLFQKAGVKTRSQLVRMALERHAHDWLPAL